MVFILCLKLLYCKTALYLQNKFRGKKECCKFWFIKYSTLNTDVHFGIVVCKYRLQTTIDFFIVKVLQNSSLLTQNVTPLRTLQLLFNMPMPMLYVYLCVYKYSRVTFKGGKEPLI